MHQPADYSASVQSLHEIKLLCSKELDTHIALKNTLLLTCNPWKWEKSILLSSQHRRITWNLSNDYFSWVSLNFRLNSGYIAKVSSIYKQLPECCMTLSCNVNSAQCCLKKRYELHKSQQYFPHCFFFLERLINSCLVLFHQKKMTSCSWPHWLTCCSIFQKSSIFMPIQRKVYKSI